MADGSQKLGAPKPALFSAVNGNIATNNNNCLPVVAPKFKISRGTQANVAVQKHFGKVSPSPPVPAKPAALSKLSKSPGPPVPPKPGAATKSVQSPLKPVISPKPALPPKPIVRTCLSSSEKPIPPNRHQRNHGEAQQHIECNDKFTFRFQDRLPVNSAQLVIKKPSRKSASLGRLEGVRCCALLVCDAKERCLQRDSGFISGSLENVGKPTFKFPSQLNTFPITPLPIAPPRRRRKSVDSYEPIYAVVDFSKKRNRRLLTTGCQSNDGSSRTYEEKQVTGTATMESIKPADCNNCLGLSDETEKSKIKVEVNSSNQTNQFKPSSQMDSDIKMIENSFATIASLIESFNHTADDSRASIPDVNIQSESGNSLGAPVGVQHEGENTDGQMIIARLVFGGTVVQKTNLLMATHPADKEKKHTKDFSAALKDIVQKQPHTEFELLSDTISTSDLKNCLREPSPTPSSSSNSSSDSKEGDIFTGKHFDPDVASCGSLGDVDTSDATRQNSVDDEAESSNCANASNTVIGEKERSHSFGFRRTFDTLFTSLSKSGIRKAAEKRKTLDFESSSTDTENVGTPRSQIYISRPAPPLPSQKFNRGERAYRSVQPAEKGRSNSVDGSLPGLDRRHASLSPVISSPDPFAPQQFDVPSEDNSASCSPPPISYSHNETGTCSTAGQNNSGRTMPYFAEDSTSDLDKYVLSLDVKERKAYMTAKEIASSERVFVDCLRLICVDFRNAVKEAAVGINSKEQTTPIIPEADLNKILNYLPQLQNLNHELLSDFELRLRNWSTLPKIADVIVRKGPFLKLYSAYIRDFQSQSALLEECVQKYPRFGKLLKQFEQSERCKNLSVKHYLLKPVQRLPQYRLLLEVYLRHLSENSADYYDTLIALKVVTDVAEHANNSMKQEDNFQKLIRLQSRLGNCEIIKPGRYIIKEGELNKVSRKTLQPRYFILLNDCLLYTSYLSSPSPNCSLKLHHELPLSRMEVHLPPVPTAQDSANEFNVISTARSFTLAALSKQERDTWMSVLSEAILELQSKQMTFPSKTSRESSEYRLGQQAPVWIPDSRVTMCQLCTAAFSITFRRHHCRACGKVVCRSCSSHKAALEYLKFRSARVCDDCFASINEHEGSVFEEGMDTSNCSSIIETDLSASLVNVNPVCFVHAFNDEAASKRPSSDPVGQTTSLAGFRAQQARRDVLRKERRNIPPRLTEVSANDAGSQISGYLSRRIRRSWKKSWFVLKDRVLYIYKASEDVVALDTIPVLGYQVQTFQEVTEEHEQNEFQLFHPKQSPIVFHAETPALTKKWVEALSSATVL